MATPSRSEKLLATVDVRELNSLRWGPLRAIFPKFAEEVELGRYLKKLLRDAQCSAVRLEVHQQPDGTPSRHVFDVYEVERP
jgi:hypothetical protein